VEVLNAPQVNKHHNNKEVINMHHSNKEVINMHHSNKEVINKEVINKHHSNMEVINKEKVEGGLPNLSKEVVEGMVDAVVVGLSVVEWCLSSIIVPPLSITNKAGELSLEEGHLRSSGAVVV
jgi:hypothetical protein